MSRERGLEQLFRRHGRTSTTRAKQQGEGLQSQYLAINAAVNTSIGRWRELKRELRRQARQDS